MGEGGVKNSEKLPTSFMDGPLAGSWLRWGKTSQVRGILDTSSHEARVLPKAKTTLYVA